MIEKLLKWFIFSVIVSLIPLAVGCVMQFTKGKLVNIDTVIAHGELLLLTASLSAASVGELLGTDGSYKIGKIVVGGMSIIIFCFVLAYFIEISSARITHESLEISAISKVSLFLYGCSIICAGGCVALSEA